MSEQLISEMTAEELRAISRKLNTYVELRPHDRDARSLAMRCKEIAALLEAPSAYHRLRVTDPGPEGLEDRVLRIASGAPLTRREIRLAGIFALVWFAMDGFWFISTFNRRALKKGKTAQLRNGTTLEPIREVLESDESDVIPCLALDSSGSARCGSLNTAVRQTAITSVTRVI